MEPDGHIRELARKTAKSIVDYGSVPMATLKETILLHEKVEELAKKEIEFPEPQEIPEVDLTPVIEKLEEVLEETKKKDYLEYDLQIDEETRKKLKGDKGDRGEKGDRGDKGEKGDNGERGTDGRNGDEITVEQIADKINSKKEIINASSIKGLLKTIGSIAESRTSIISTGSPVPTPSSKVFTYNPDGTLLRYTNGRGTKTFSYDSSGLLTSSSGTGVYNNWTFTYSNGVLTNVNLI